MPLIDWKLLRASYTPIHSDDVCIVKEMKIGQSAAKGLTEFKVQRLAVRRTLQVKWKWGTLHLLLDLPLGV